MEVKKPEKKECWVRHYKIPERGCETCMRISEYNAAIDAMNEWLGSEGCRELLRDIIVKHTSEMLDNPDRYGIYRTTKFYNNLITAISEYLGKPNE